LKFCTIKCNRQLVTNKQLIALTYCNNPIGKLFSTHLLGISKLQLTVKKLVHKDVDFCVQNAPKLTYENAKFQKVFKGLYLRIPVKRGGREERK